MNSCNDLTTASREELLELVGRLLEQVQVLEARIAELEGPQKAAAEIFPGEKKPPSWVKANQPIGAKRERKKRAHGFARRREEPTHRTEHALEEFDGVLVSDFYGAYNVYQGPQQRAGGTFCGQCTN